MKKLKTIIYPNLILEKINLSRKNHIPQSKIFKQSQENLNKLQVIIDKNKIEKFNFFKKFNFFFPFHSFGNLNSSDQILSLNNLIVFNLINKLNNHYNKICDLGGCIGFHTIIFNKLGFKVRTYEPDRIHYAILKKNIKLNKLKNTTLFNFAVSKKDDSEIFTKVLDNTTASFINNYKQPYGKIEKYKVKCKNFLGILKWGDIFKIDIEGMEYEIFSLLNKKNIKNKFLFFEIDNLKTRKMIFVHSLKKKLSLYSQKKGWEKVNKITDLPKDWREGSFLLTENKKVFFEILRKYK
tara:strand:- start:1627 stop:2511 length:885 start_codon:yes stop_codon:yes gene_type:complete